MIRWLAAPAALWHGIAYRIGRAGGITCEAEDAPDSKCYRSLSAINCPSAAVGAIENKMQLQISRLLLLIAWIALAACATGPKGVRITNGGTSAISAQPGEPIRDLSAAEIGQRIIGKTFQYTRNTGNGFVTYNADGTFDYQDDTKGAGNGRWSVSGTQYCEKFGEKAQQECGTFRTTGDAYFAANTRLVEMKI